MLKLGLGGFGTCTRQTMLMPSVPKEAASLGNRLSHASYVVKLRPATSCSLRKRVQRIAQLPQKDDWAYNDETSKNPPTPKSAGRKTVRGTECTDTPAYFVPPYKRKNAQGDDRQEQLHYPIGEGVFPIRIFDVIPHLGVLYHGINTQRNR